MFTLNLPTIPEGRLKFAASGLLPAVYTSAFGCRNSEQSLRQSTLHVPIDLSSSLKCPLKSGLFHWSARSHTDDWRSSTGLERCARSAIAIVRCCTSITRARSCSANRDSESAPSSWRSSTFSWEFGERELQRRVRAEQGEPCRHLHKELTFCTDWEFNERNCVTELEFQYSIERDFDVSLLECIVSKIFRLRVVGERHCIAFCNLSEF